MSYSNPVPSTRTVASCLAIFLIVLVHRYSVECAVYTPSGGPIYVNPDAASSVIQLVQPTPTGSYVTKTVYGFLDFTTTIGNTVMVFSPQSVAVENALQSSKPVEMPSSSIIQTQPTVAKLESSSVIQISPSRPVPKAPTVVEVKSQQLPKIQSNVVQVKNVPSSKVNIFEPATSKPKHTPPLPPTSKVDLFGGPASKSQPPQRVVFTKVDVFEGPSKVVNNRANAGLDLFGGPPVVKSTPPASKLFASVVDVEPSDYEPVFLGNNIGEPEYDFLSRQPVEFVEQTYKVVNLKPSTKFHLKPRQSSEPKPRHNVAATKKDSAHPTGLVTKLGGTVVKDGTTTVHETSVIGTYISGKYAQVLQSSSRILSNDAKPKPTPASSLRILKTAAPVLGKNHRANPVLDPTPSGLLHEETAALPLEALFSSAQTSNLIRPSRRPAISGGNFKNRFKGRTPNRDHLDAKDELDFNDEYQDLSPPNHNGFNRKAPRVQPTQTRHKYKNNKFGRTSTAALATVSVFSEATVAPSGGRKHYQSPRRNNFRSGATATPNDNNNNNNGNAGGYSRRGYKPRVQTSAVEPVLAQSTTLYKFKLNRQPGRWQYKTSPKPRVTIRRQNDEDYDSATLPTTNGLSLQDVSPLLNDVVTPQSRSDEIDLEPSGSSDGLSHLNDEDSAADNKIDQAVVMETIKVEISTPADFKDVYYEIATIKSPYTFQVGSLKNTRYITVTSTFEKSLIEPTETPSRISPTEPLTENILQTPTNYDKEHHLLGTSIATLPPIALANDMETPPLETMTETFSTTQQMLKTHILPVIHGGNMTTSYTLVQTYHVTRFVTATKTLPPMEVYQFVPSKTLKEFNSRLDEAGSELHLELEFGDENDQDGENIPKRIFPSDLDLANVGSDFNLSDVDKLGLLESHLRLKKAHGPTTPKPMEAVPTPGLTPEQIQQLALLRFLNPAAQIPQVITTSKPVVKLETVFESHVIPIFNGQSTMYSTISRPVATVSKTEFEFGTSTLPAIPTNPLFPQQPQQQFTVTSTPVVTQTMVTETESKVLKLTFGAKTAYTTLFSTKVVPTVLTTYVTTSVPVQPTAAFPGFFPPPYAPFPYVG